LKYEDGRLFRRLTPSTRGEEPKWEEDVRIQPEERWLAIQRVRENTDFETGETISGLVFIGVLGHKHQCRPATNEEMQQPEAELIREPTAFMYAQQRFSEVLVEVLGA
jgi:hypothetical protein